MIALLFWVFDDEMVFYRLIDKERYLNLKIEMKSFIYIFLWFW